MATEHDPNKVRIRKDSTKLLRPWTVTTPGAAGPVSFHTWYGARSFAESWLDHVGATAPAAPPPAAEDCLHWKFPGAVCSHGEPEGEQRRRGLAQAAVRAMDAYGVSVVLGPNAAKARERAQQWLEACPTGAPYAPVPYCSWCDAFHGGRCRA